MVNYQSIIGTNLVNEFKVGYNRPETSALAFGPPGYDATGVSLSGTFTSSSIDARGNTGIARSGLLIRATQRVVDDRLDLRPDVAVVHQRTTWTRGAHTT